MDFYKATQVPSMKFMLTISNEDDETQYLVLSNIVIKLSPKTQKYLIFDERKNMEISVGEKKYIIDKFCNYVVIKEDKIFSFTMKQ